MRADVPAIAALHAQDAVGGHGDTANPVALPDYLAAFDAIAANPAATLYVAEADGAIAGTFQLTFIRVMTGRGALHLDIEAVRVDEALQGRGIGAAMMRFAIEQARAAGCKSVKLTSNASRTDAHRFYEQLGFAKSHAGFKLKL